MFSSGLSPGVTCGPIRNTLGLGATTGSPRMRLRLFERLGRLVSWRFGSQGDRDGRSRDSRATGAEASGRHRRNAVGGQTRDRAVAALSQRARSQPPPPLQPPAGLPRRDLQSPRLAPRTSPSRRPGRARRCGHAAAAKELRPRPGRRHRAGTDQGGAIRRRTARHGHPPATRCGPGLRCRAPGRSAQAPRQPWYQVVGGPPAARRLAGQAGQAGQAARPGWPRPAMARPPRRRRPRRPRHPRTAPARCCRSPRRTRTATR